MDTQNATLDSVKPYINILAVNLSCISYSLCKSDEYGMLHCSVVLVGVVAIMVLPIREPNVGGIS